MKIKYLELNHNEITYYMCKICGVDLLRICYVARRGESDEEGAVQRILNKRRISGIAEYLLNGGYFPTNIIVNVANPDNIAFDNKEQVMDLASDEHIAQVLDGQHRIAGMREAMKQNKEIGSIEFPVLIAVGLTTAECAKVFVSINNEQKTVPTSLIYDLYGMVDMPDKDFSVIRGRDIAEVLNRDDDSPYQGLVKFPGSSKFVGGIQLSSMVNSMKPLLRKNGEFAKFGINSLERQSKLLKNYFSAIAFFYENKWNDRSNPFIYASGFSAAVELLTNKVLPYCFSRQSFTQETFRSVFFLTKDTLLKQSDVKNKSGETQKQEIYSRLLEFINVEGIKEEELEF